MMDLMDSKILNKFNKNILFIFSKIKNFNRNYIQDKKNLMKKEHNL